MPNRDVPGFILIASLALLTASAALAQEVGVSQNAILIGSCSDLVGSNRVRSSELLDGARAYLASINADGGVYGRKLTLISSDDSGDPKQAVACFNKLRDQGVFAGAFFMSSPPASRYAPMAEYNRIPVLGFVSGAHFLYEPVKHYVFPVHPTHRNSVSAFLEEAAKKLPLRKVALVQEDNAFGKSVSDAVLWTVSKQNLPAAEIVTLSQNDHDATKQAVLQLRSSGAQIVFLALSAPLMADFVKTSSQLNWSPHFVLFSNYDTVRDAGDKNLEGALILEPFPGADQTEYPMVVQYRQLLKKYVKGAAPSYIGIEGFVHAMVLVEGLKRAGRSLTRDKFVDALESIQNLDIGLGSRYKLSITGDNHVGTTSMSPTMIHDSKEIPLDWSLVKGQALPSR